jgi:hypothetical protein
MSQTDAPQASATQPAEPKRRSPIRLLVLLGLLAIVLGAFLFDLFYMYDAVNAATVRLQAAADEMSARPRKDGNNQFLTKEGAAQAIGFQPTRSRVEGGQLIEQYRWWGALPLERRYIEAIYQDADGQRYDHYTISNPDIYGNDVDPEAVKLNSDSPASDPATPQPETSSAGEGKTPGDVKTTPAGEDPVPSAYPSTPNVNDSSPDESDAKDKPAEDDPNET